MAEIGLIVGDTALPTAGDTTLNTLLLTEHSVTMHSDNDTIPSGKDGFVIAASVSQVPLSTSGYQTNSEPMLVLDVDFWDELLITNTGVSNGGNDTILDLLPHDITLGLSDPLTYNEFNMGMWGTPLANFCTGVQVFAKHPVTVNHILGFAIPIGAALLTGNATRNLVGITLIDGATANLTNDAKQLFLNAVNWMLTFIPPVNQFTSISAFSIARRVYAKRAGIT